MPNFNKGDFTQQGVNGHVNANVRLNEKRLVNIDMTSNEEAEGCTIAGTVTDLLNDKIYNIGSAPTGNIEITENGENINVAPYATATVNVAGGGDAPKKCTVTIVNNGEVTAYPNLQYVFANNLIAELYSGELPGSQSLNCDYLYTTESFIFGLTGRSTVPITESLFTNAVNCSVNIDTEYNEWNAIVTDPTMDSSITIDVTAFSGLS